MFEIQRQLDAGQQDLGLLVQSLRKQIEDTAGVNLDYAVIVDSESLAELNAIQPNMVALVAAQVGTTRLIDNLILRM
jgi:pantoate--beta-alanine ligase